MKEISIFIVVLFSVVSFSQHSHANACYELFHQDPRVKAGEPFSDPEKLFFILKSKALSQDASGKNINFKLGSEFLHEPNQMLKEIETFESYNLNEQQRTFIEQTKQEIIEVIQDDVPYGAYIRVAYRFSVAASEILKPSRKPIDWESSYQLIGDLNAKLFSEGFFQIPSFENVANRFDFLEKSRGVPVYILSLSLTEFANMSPRTLFFHDAVNHTRYEFVADRKLYSGQDSFDELMEKSRKVNFLLRSMIASAKVQPHADILEALLFASLHEGSTPLNLQEFLDPERTKNIVSSEFGRQELGIVNRLLRRLKPGESYSDMKIFSKDVDEMFTECLQIFLNWRSQFIADHIDLIRQI